jgi:DNA-binding transcriptional LysR family regulator
MYFVKVMEFGGFSEAGRRLGIPKSRLSRRVAELENRVGVRLLQRSSRRVTLTGAGQSFFERCQAVVRLAESANDVVMQQSAEAQGDVRISCPITLAQVWLTPLVPGFMKAYPKVRLHIATTNRRIDPVEERMDVVLRVRHLPVEDSDQVVRKLGESTDILVASPGFLHAIARPRDPEDLARLPTLSWFGSGSRFTWSLTDGRRVVEVRHEPHLVTDDMFALKAAALSGVGIALLPGRICRTEVQEGRLALVLPAWTSPLAHVQAAFMSRRGMTPAVRALLDYLDQHREND